MKKPKPSAPHDAFTRLVVAALKAYPDPVALGRSPLAAPYCLGRRLQQAPPAADPVARRGNVLRQAIDAAHDRLWPGPMPPQSAAALRRAVWRRRDKRGDLARGARFDYLVLELRYLRRLYGRRTPPDPGRDALLHFFAQPYAEQPGRRYATSTWGRHLDAAEARFAASLLAILQPTFHLEQPAPAPTVVGRSADLAALETALRQHRAAAITGPGGRGKTTLGAAVFAGRPLDARFWCTIRPGLSDDLGSVLFSLGHFLDARGDSLLWLHLQSRPDQPIGAGRALGLLRADLDAQQADAGDRPLLCFDEIDLLQASDDAPRRAQHVQLLEFIDSLRQLPVDLLLIGQRITIDVPLVLEPQPLDAAQLRELAATGDLSLAAADVEQLHALTGGNPRRATLALALLRRGESMASLTDAPERTATDALVARVWKRLDSAERLILAALSVYRTAAPADLFDESDAALALLAARGLLQHDAAGGLLLPAALRPLVYRLLSPEQRDALHMTAWTERARRGAITAAVYHQLAAGAVADAVDGWYANMEAELRRGQAAAARALFGELSADRLDARRGKKLMAIRNRLFLLEGDAARVLAGVEQYTHAPDDELDALILQQRATAHRHLNEVDAALAAHEAAQAILGRVATRAVSGRRGRGQLFIRTAAMEQAALEADAAEYEVHWLRATLAAAAGRYSAAEPSYRDALRLAERLDRPQLLGRAHYGLMQLYGKRRQIETAHEHGRAALAAFERLGDRYQQALTRAEMAGMLVDVGRYQEVIAPMTQSLRYFRAIRHERMEAKCLNNLAEAHMELGNLAQARQDAEAVIALEIARPMPYAYYTLGHVERKEGALDKAAARFEQGIRASETTSDPFIAAYLYLSLGSLLAAGARAGDGLNALRRAHNLFAEMGQTEKGSEVREAIATARLGRPPLTAASLTVVTALPAARLVDLQREFVCDDPAALAAIEWPALQAWLGKAL